MVVFGNYVSNVNIKRARITPQAGEWPRRLELMAGNTCLAINIVGTPRDADIQFYSDGVPADVKRQFIREMMDLETNTFIGWMEALVADFIGRDPGSTAWLADTEIEKFLRNECDLTITALFNLSGPEDENSNTIPDHVPYPLGIIVKEL